MASDDQDNDDLDKIEVKLTDVEIQFLIHELRRRDKLVKFIIDTYAQTINHFTSMCAVRKGVQFDQARFAGVNVDIKKKKFLLLLHKNLPKTQKPTEQSAPAAS